MLYLKFINCSPAAAKATSAKVVLKGTKGVKEEDSKKTSRQHHASACINDFQIHLTKSVLVLSRKDDHRATQKNR